ncbi:MAG: DnaJ domain-containing protein [Cyclobacteriaceae bacterium]
MKDYYATLEVSASASEMEIKKAFRKLAVRYHPDKNASADAKPRFLEINEAYDVLGDRVKRALYDERLSNPFSELLEDPVPKHRDPAYRRKRPDQAYKREPPASYVLMRDYLKYMLWVSRIGLLTTSLFFLDYLVPYRQIVEDIEEIYAVRMRRGGVAYHIIITESGRKIKLYDYQGSYFRNEGTIKSTLTRIYGTAMSVSNTSGTHVVELGYMYSTLIFFPIILFVNSLMALLFRKRVELSFNLNVTGIILLIINFVMI